MVFKKCLYCKPVIVSLDSKDALGACNNGDWFNTTCAGGDTPDTEVTTCNAGTGADTACGNGYGFDDQDACFATGGSAVGECGGGAGASCADGNTTA